jgi:hypothetical protein
VTGWAEGERREGQVCRDSGSVPEQGGGGEGEGREGGIPKYQRGREGGVDDSSDAVFKGITGREGEGERERERERE